jgi:signal transduction histidine kinase
MELGHCTAVLVALYAGAAPPTLEQSSFTTDERQWLAKHPVVRVAHGSGGPFAFLDERGQLVGLALDYAEAFAASTGVQFEHHLEPGLESAFEGLRAQRYDAVMGIGQVPDREAFLLFGAPFAYSPDAIVTRTDGPYVFDVRELGGKRVAIARSSTSVARTLRERVPDAEVVTYAAMEEAIVAVSRGEAFVAITDASVAAFTVKRRVLANLRIAGLFEASADVHLGVRRDWPELVSILDKALASLPAAERMQMADRWMVLDYESDRRWQRAFTLALVVLVVGSLGFAALALFHRKMKGELAQRERVQRELEETRDQLARIDQEKTELLRVVAHDLRNPVTSLLLNTELLTLSREAPDAVTLAEMISSIERMRSLIALLVDRKALESGHPTWTRTRLDPGKEALAAITGVSEAARRKGIDVTMRADPELPAIESDQGAFRQVVDNLVSNAVKYSPPGSLVQVDVARSSDALRIAVRDQGPGVPLAERASIFEKFQVGSARPTGGETSSGLGLWIVSRIVEQMHGRVWCEGERGQGSVFVVEVPVKDGRSAAPAGGERHPVTPRRPAVTSIW